MNYVFNNYVFIEGDDAMRNILKRRKTVSEPSEMATHSAKAHSDVLGSYTGTPANMFETPEQDADDL